MSPLSDVSRGIHSALSFRQLSRRYEPRVYSSEPYVTARLDFIQGRTSLNIPQLDTQGQGARFIATLEPVQEVRKLVV